MASAGCTQRLQEFGLLAVILLVLVAQSPAQKAGSISGYVRDSTGAVVTGTTVSAVMNEQQTSAHCHDRQSRFL
jgi:hypothetical protein